MSLSPAQRLALGSGKFPDGHVIKPADRPRIACSMPGCRDRAHFTLYARWVQQGRKGIAFYSYCPAHWVKVGPMGTSPKERAMQSGPRLITAASLAAVADFEEPGSNPIRSGPDPEDLAAHAGSSS